LETNLIHEDERGQIICFYLRGKEYTLLTTKRGFARGGCIHNKTEYAVVLEGIIEYHIKGRTRFTTLSKGENIQVPPETPHYIIAVTDAIMMEWGAPPDQKKRKDKEFRAIVDKINEGKK
jgi:hypothetical protein